MLDKTVSRRYCFELFYERDGVTSSVDYNDG